MPQVFAAVAPALFGAGGSLALVTAAGGLTLAGAVTSVGVSLLASAAARALVQDRIDALGNVEPGQTSRPEDIRVTRRAAAAPRLRHYGQVKVAGQLVFFRAKAGTLHRVLVFGHGLIDEVLGYELDGKSVARDGSGFVTTAQYDVNGTKRVRIQQRTGGPAATYYSTLEGVYAAWDSTHRLRGLWSSYMSTQQVGPSRFREVYPNGAPELTAEARASLVHDPRDGLTNWSELAALCIADYLQHPDGMGLTDLVDTTVLATAATHSAENIALAAGGTERRYRISGSYQLTDEPQAVLRRMLTACNGDLQLLPSGKIGIHVGRWVAPTVTLAQSEILSLDRWDDGPDRLERYNELPALYTDRSLNYQTTSMDAWVDGTRETADGERLIGPQLDLGMAPSHGQSRRCAKYRIEVDNPKYRVTVRCKPAAMRCIYERYIEITWSVLPSVYWRVEGWSLDPQTCQITLELASFNEACLTWSSAEEGAAQALPAADSATSLPVPQNVSAAAEGKKTSQTGWSAGIGVVWDAPDNDALAPEVRYTLAASVSIVEYERWPVDDGATKARIAPLLDGALYDVSVRFRTSDGLRSDWVTVTDVTARALTGTPNDATGFSVTDLGSGQARVQFTTSDSEGLWKTEVFSGSSIVARFFNPPWDAERAVTVDDEPGAGSHTYKIRTVNVSGSFNDTADITRTIT